MPRRLTEQQLMRMARDHDHPQSMEEVIDDEATYSADVLQAVRAYARSKPWQGTIAQRQAKLMALHLELCRIYDRPVELHFNISSEGETDQARCRFMARSDSIVIGGRISVVNYLHTFAAALGKTSRSRFKWSVNLFRRCFPRSYANLQIDGPMLRREVTTNDESEGDAND
jgi:hypothetical protein